MRLKAIRVAECGRFAEPVAVEGLSGGLDVLVGPNEAGKSTLLKAVRLAILQKHTSNHADVKSLRPYGGGAPLVEVDFEARGELWRLRKRYLSERRAELASIGSGRIERGAEAEQLLEQLIGDAGGTGRFALLWVGQRGLLDAPDPDASGTDALRAAIAAEVADVGGGDLLRRLRTEVQAMLEVHVTLRQGRKRGRYEAAENQARAAASELAAARQRIDEIEILSDRLASIEDRISALGDPAMAATRRRLMAEAEAAIGMAHETIAARDAARVTAAEARGRLDRTAAAIMALTAKLTELDRLAALDAEDAAEAQSELERLTQEEALFTEVRNRSAMAEADLERASADLAVLRALEVWRALDDRAGRAVGAAQRANEFRQQLAGLPGDEHLLVEARRLASRIGENKAKLEAQSATVSVAYLPGALARIRSDRGPIDDGARVVVDRVFVLDIDGIGRVTIEPGMSEGRAEIATALARDEERISECLAAAGAHDFADLEDRYSAARDIAASLKAAETELAALAPEGLDRLEKARDEAVARIDRSSPHVVRGPAPGGGGIREQELLVERLRDAAKSAEDCKHVVEQTLDRLLRNAAARSARLAEREGRRAVIASGLPAPADRVAHRRRLEAEGEVESKAFDEALRALSGWELKALDAAGVARLEAELAGARAADDGAKQQMGVLVAERSRIEGALEGVGKEDIVAHLAALEADAERAAATLADLEEEVAALRLLDAELAVEAERFKVHYLAPVLARLAPYLELLFPDSNVEFAEGYRLAGIARQGRNEDVSRLSDGTREQLAVLVRLAFGRLLADQGRAAPLVLDDALVYSDDCRIAAMHKAMQRAAEAHQVILLTCREHAFAGLGGHRLSLQPWRP